MSRQRILFILWYYCRSFLTTLGLLWLIVEPIIGLTKISLNLSYAQLLSFSFVGGTLWFFIDGFFISGFMRKSIEISSTAFDTKIQVLFGNIFSQDGWKSIAVNDFFDSIVDDIYISSKSLHGIFLRNHWHGTTEEWDNQICQSLQACIAKDVSRSKGKQKRYEIGTTADVKSDGCKFLCVALTYTNISTLEVKANSSELIKAVRGLLCKARSVCANETLNIPLFGSGLSRVGIKSNILVDLILTAIFEETKINKVTNLIRIVLPDVMSSEINLANIKRDWS